MTPKEQLEFYSRIFLVVVVTLATVGVIFLMLMSDVEASPQAYLIVGSLIGAFSLIVGYHYGSSSGSAAKQETIDKAAIAKAVVDGKVAVIEASNTDTTKEPKT